jgi:CMP-N,N'-diacetyllegionaminic acid synthase
MIAIVPARGGSKGLSRKNLRLLAGKPLIVHTLECALASRTISRVVVSTDDEEIAQVARAVNGVDVPFVRPSALSGDNASAVDVYLHAASELSSKASPVGVLCALLPTAPLRQPADIDACVGLFRQKKAAVVLSVVGAKPAEWHQAMAQTGQLSSFAGEPSSVDNRQGYDKRVMPNGAVYVLDISALTATRTYFGPRTFGYEMPGSRSIDIDNDDDLLMAEALLAHWRRN